jgi:hypothetical protein
MKTTRILLLTSILAGLTAISVSARGPGGGGSGSCQGGSGPRDPSLCDGSGRGQGTPLHDGSGKATAPGKGAKDGTGNKANCPTPPAKS